MTFGNPVSVSEKSLWEGQCFLSHLVGLLGCLGGGRVSVVFHVAVFIKAMLYHLMKLGWVEEAVLCGERAV